jgi:hypothetical protein
MRFLHVLKRKKLIFLNIFLFSYVLINFFDGDRGFYSYLDNKNKKDNLINKKEMLTKKLNVVEHKNNLLSDELNLLIYFYYYFIRVTKFKFFSY